MIAALLAALLFLWVSAAHAQTYFGVLTDPENTGPGGSCCSTTAMTDVNSAPAPTGYSVITANQFNAYKSATIDSYAAQYAVRIATGLALTSTGTSALNATYPLDNDTISNLQGLYFRAQIAKLSSTESFGPNGETSVALRDVSGGYHSFDRDHIIAYGDKVASYRGLLTPEAVGSLGWPANNQVTIP